MLQAIDFANSTCVTASTEVFINQHSSSAFSLLFFTSVVSFNFLSAARFYLRNIHHTKPGFDMKHLSGIWIAALILIMAGCDDNSKSPSDNGMPTHCPTTCINGCNPDGSCKDSKAECPVTCTNGCNPDGSCKDGKAECPVTCTNGCNPDGSCKDGKAECPATCTNGCNPDGSCKDSKAECPTTCTNGCNPDGSCKDSKAECPTTCTNGCNPDGSCKDGKAECPTTCTNGCNPDGSCKTNETESCPASCEYGCNQNNECIDISHAKSGDYCSRPFSTCIDNSVYECAANNTLYIDDCNIVNAECRVENVVCNEGECADDDYIHIDIRAFCKDMCASGYKGNSCKDDIQKGDECSGAGSFCKDNNLYLCESSKYKVIDCGAMHLKCVDKDEYWSYCLDLCTKKEYETHAKKIQCVTNYYDSSFNRSYDSPDNAPYYLELFCQKHLSLEGVYHWDWEDSFSGQMCPGVCDKKTDTCKKYPDLGKSCSTEESDPKYYASK